MAAVTPADRRLVRELLHKPAHPRYPTPRDVPARVWAQTLAIVLIPMALALRGLWRLHETTPPNAYAPHIGALLMVVGFGIGAYRKRYQWDAAWHGLRFASWPALAWWMAFWTGTLWYGEPAPEVAQTAPPFVAPRTGGMRPAAAVVPTAQVHTPPVPDAVVVLTPEPVVAPVAAAVAMAEPAAKVIIEAQPEVAYAAGLAAGQAGIVVVTGALDGAQVAASTGAAVVESSVTGAQMAQDTAAAVVAAQDAARRAVEAGRAAQAQGAPAAAGEAASVAASVGAQVAPAVVAAREAGEAAAEAGVPESAGQAAGVAAQAGAWLCQVVGRCR